MSDDKKDQEMVRLVQHVRDGNCPAAKLVTIGAFANGDFVVTALSEVTKAVDANKRISELETELANLKTAYHVASARACLELLNSDQFRCLECRVYDGCHSAVCSRVIKTGRQLITKQDHDDAVDNARHLSLLRTALHEAGLECEGDTLRCRHCRLRNNRHEVTCANAPPSLNKLELAQALEALKEKFTK